MDRKLNVAVVGLGFGGAFAPIYCRHPDVQWVGIFDPNRALAEEFRQKYSIDRVYDSFDEVIADDTLDAVHLVSPIPLHEEQSQRVLKSGKHCACTVPMGITLEGIQGIVDAARSSGKRYMMMETSVYTTHFFHAKQMLETGLIGRIQFLRGAHYQDMEYWPDYWMGLPPMFYGTHAIAPLVMLAGSRIARVHGFGSGTMREELHAQYGNPFPVETAILEFENGLKAEVTRSLFETARGYTESFNVYGSKQSFEWPQIESEDEPIIFELQPQTPGLRGLVTDTRRVKCRNRLELLPEEIRPFAVKDGAYDELNPHLTIQESGGHGGSHPHMVHEFVRCILENRPPYVDEALGANISAAGVCAHLSAMQGGAPVDVPVF